MGPTATVRSAVRRTAATLVVAIVGAGGLAACGGGSSGGAAGGSDTLTMQFAGPPISMDPAKAGNGGSAVFVSLAYDPLIYQTGDGKLVPDLATKWNYVGKGNKVFQFDLRPGVRFTDGGRLDADAVVASMNYFLKAGGGLVGNVGSIGSVKAVDNDTVRITYDKPNPIAPLTLSQYFGIGNIIGPKGLADTKSLLTASDGTGQYVYDGSKSVAGSRYEYTRNPHYFAPDAQHFKNVSVRIIGDPNSVLSAAQTHQVQYAAGNSQTAEAAKKAGIKVQTAPFFNWSLILADRQGVVSKPLADVRVRRAISLAFDRKSLASALGGQYASPSGQLVLPGVSGYVDGGDYGYDIAQAKKLLAQAGYPHGFKLTVLTQSLIDPNTKYSQAIANALGDVGIDVTLKVESTGIAQFTADSESKKYAAILFPSAGASMYEVSSQVSSGLFNPFGSKDPQIDRLLTKANAATGAEQEKLDEQVTKRYSELAWIVPIMATENVQFLDPGLKHVTSSTLNPNPMPTGPTAALSWSRG